MKYSAIAAMLAGVAMVSCKATSHDNDYSVMHRLKGAITD